MPPTPVAPPHPSNDGSGRWWVVSQANIIWLVESQTRPNIPVDRGVKHIVPIFGPATKEQAVDFGDRTTKTSNARWRA